LYGTAVGLSWSMEVMPHSSAKTQTRDCFGIVVSEN